MSEYKLFRELEIDGNLSYEGLELSYLPNILEANILDSILKNLINLNEWNFDTFKIMGKNITLKRRTAFFGDKNICYNYSGNKREASLWTEELLFLKRKVESKTNLVFNSVLLNDYANGEIGMGWHSDDETELGFNPGIASLSLGVSRDFLFKHKYNEKFNKVKLKLENGSLLLMHGRSQHLWSHSLPKRLRVLERRINLTFRNIIK
tara:strand:+ start:1505 stop:2125 length:621 start_codon:yes stop_codon:yes gene_type:complete